MGNKITVWCMSVESISGNHYLAAYGSENELLDSLLDQFDEENKYDRDTVVESLCDDGHIIHIDTSTVTVPATIK